jgi:uncharacterized membrane protein
VLSFVVSFVNLGRYCVAHNNEAKEVERTWRGMRWINLLFLMFVVLVPFSTALVSHYAQPGAIRIYACSLIAVGLALEFLWVYGYKNKPMKPPVNSDFVTRGKIPNIVAPICYLVALALSFFARLGLEQFAYMPVHTDHLCRICGSNNSKAARRKKKGACR